MRRFKIKKKYLVQQENIYDKIERIIIKSLITFCLIVLMIFWGAIPNFILAIFGVNANEMNLAMRVVISFVFDVLFLILLCSFYYSSLKMDFKNYFNSHFWDHFRESFSVWVLGFGIMVVSNLLITILTNGQIAQNEEAVRSLIDQYPLYMAFQLMIYAPISEEIIFRKSIKNIIPKGRLYILVSGFIFGGLHVISSLDYHLGFLFLIPYCSLGCLFANLYEKKDNIFYTIMAHSIHNTFALLVYLMGVK